MLNSRILGYATLVLLFAVAGCTVDKSAKDKALKNQDLVFSGESEPVSGKSDTYTSMARAVKYNVDVASNNLSKKIYNQNPNLKPEDIIQNVLNSNVSDTNQLYNMSRVLEFSVVYAMANLNEDRDFVENYFYNKSAQHLSLAAIRSHQDSWWGERNMREIDRIIRQQQKIVKELAAKEDRAGGLSNDDIHYKKNLEVALLKLGELQKALLFERVEYGQLTKTPAKDINLEGRKFYQLEDFDKKYTLEIFQEAAVRNRNEFAVAKEQVKNYNYGEIRSKVIREYPLVERLDINGLNIEDEVYYKAMQKRVLMIANNLIKAVMKYRNAKKGKDDVKTALLRQAYDELGAAILTQVDINYQLLRMADIDYENIQREIVEKTQTLRTLDKNYRMNTDQKLELLNAKIALLELQRKAAQILAERAVALRGLYFNAGFSPFSRTILRAPIKDVVGVLKIGFNKDVVEMLAAASVPVKRNADPAVNDWAKNPNWLEDLMQTPGTAKAKTVESSDTEIPSLMGEVNSKPYDEAAAKFRTMQLGAYEQKDNAMADWEKLTGQFTALKNYNPGLERSKSSGKILYKLVVHDSKGGLQNICNQMRAVGAECLLK